MTTLPNLSVRVRRTVGATPSTVSDQSPRRCAPWTGGGTTINRCRSRSTGAEYSYRMCCSSSSERLGGGARGGGAPPPPHAAHPGDVVTGIEGPPPVVQEDLHPGAEVHGVIGGRDPDVGQVPEGVPSRDVEGRAK